MVIHAGHIDVLREHGPWAREPAGFPVNLSLHRIVCCTGEDGAVAAGLQGRAVPTPSGAGGGRIENECTGNGPNRNEPDTRKHISLTSEHPPLTHRGEAGKPRRPGKNPVRYPPSGGSGCIPLVLPDRMGNVLFKLRKHHCSTAPRISFAGSNHHKLHTCRGHKILPGSCSIVVSGLQSVKPCSWIVKGKAQKITVREIKRVRYYRSKSPIPSQPRIAKRPLNKWCSGRREKLKDAQINSIDGWDP